MKSERAFWDTSGIVPLCVHQSVTSVLGRLARHYPRIVVWWGTSVEARSAIARLRREGALDEAGAHRASRRLEMLRSRWSEVVPTDEVRALADEILDRHVLTAADSLQLGAALVWCGGNPRRRPAICCDRHLARAFAAEGFGVHPDR